MEDRLQWIKAASPGLGRLGAGARRAARRMRWSSGATRKAGCLVSEPQPVRRSGRQQSAQPGGGAGPGPRASSPCPDAGVQMLWANMALHMAARAAGTDRAMAPARGRWLPDVLLPGARFAARVARDVRALGWPPPAHDFTDMHDWGDMLVHAGFAEPVMDMERITLTWETPARLLQELRELGANLHKARHGRLRVRHRRARVTCHAAPGADWRRARAVPASRRAGVSQVSVMRSMSITGSAKPACTSMSPQSCMSVNSCAGGGQPSARVERRAARARCPARGRRTSGSRRPRAPRASCAMSACGSAAMCSAMLAHSICTPPSGTGADVQRGCGPAPPPRPPRAARRPRHDPAAARPRAPGLRVAPRHQRMRPQAAAHRLPVGPGLGLQPDPLQPVRHAPPHLLVQPGRPGRRDARPSARPRPDRWWAGVRAAHGGVCNEYIDPMLSRARSQRCDGRAARPVRGLPRLAGPAACATPASARFAQPQPRCRRCALPVAGGRAPMRRAASRQPPPLDACHAAVPYAYPVVGAASRSTSSTARPAGRARFATLDAQRALGRPALEQARPRAADAAVARSGWPSAASTRHCCWRAQLAPAQDDAALLLRVRHTPRRRRSTAGARLPTCRAPSRSIRCAPASCAAARAAGRRRDDQRRFCSARPRRCARPARPRHRPSCWRAPTSR